MSKQHTVAATKMELAEMPRKTEGADADWLRKGVRVLAQALMDAEVPVQIGAEHGAAHPPSGDLPMATGPGTETSTTSSRGEGWWSWRRSSCSSRTPARVITTPR
jgi:hypothetical protein